VLVKANPPSQSALRAVTDAIAANPAGPQREKHCSTCGLEHPPAYETVPVRAGHHPCPVCRNGSDQRGARRAGCRAPIDIPSGRTAADRDDIETLWGALPEPIDLHLAIDGTLVWTDRGAELQGNTVNRARVKPEVGCPQICSRGYKEAIGLTTANGVTYVSDLGGLIRVINLSEVSDRELINLGPGLTGLALADF